MAGPQELKVGGGWIRPPIFGPVSMVLLVAVLVGYARWVTVPDSGPIGNLYEGLALAIASILVVLLVSTFFCFVRSVDLSDEVVEFAVGTRRLRIQWEDLVPPNSPYFLGINFRYKVGGEIQDRDALFLTRAQANAILGHPSCPPWKISLQVRESLSFTAK
jgi:hypothetical protein